MRILYVENKEKEREIIANFLRKHEHAVIEASNPIEALEIFYDEHIDLVISDFRMPEMSGTELLTKIKEINPILPFILVTAYGDIDLAVSVIKKGAAEFLEKPVKFSILLNKIKEIEKNYYLKSEIESFSNINDELRKELNFPNIVYKSKKMLKILAKLSRVAKVNLPILITGESGTGKELIADMIHKLSNRKDKPFLKLNCAAIPDALLESELFGYEKGSFTGANTKKKGKIESANKGTVFLDEIGELSYSLQSKLLRFSQNSEIQKLGNDESLKVDVRIISATNKDLEELVTQGRFREDLFFRINVITLDIPPLRERKEDIPLLVEHFIKEYSAINSVEKKELTQKALNKLMKYDFPGNVRELKNIINNAMIFSLGDAILPEDLNLPQKRKSKKHKKSMSKTIKMHAENSEKIKNNKDLVLKFIKDLYYFSTKITEDDAEMDYKNIENNEYSTVIEPNSHYKIRNNTLAINPKKCISQMEKYGVYYNKNELLRKLKESKYFNTNEGLIYFDKKKRRVWEFKLDKIINELNINFREDKSIPINK